MKSRSSTAFTGIASISVFAAVAVGMFVVGTPGDARLQHLDDLRLQAVQSLSTSLDGYWLSHDALPNALDKLAADRAIMFVQSRDPGTGASYEYHRLSANSYELCAIFATSTEAGGEVAIGWRHARGRYCFSFKSLNRQDHGGPVIPTPHRN